MAYNISRPYPIVDSISKQKKKRGFMYMENDIFSKTEELNSYSHCIVIIELTPFGDTVKENNL